MGLLELWLGCGVSSPLQQGGMLKGFLSPIARAPDRNLPDTLASQRTLTD